MLLVALAALALNWRSIRMQWRYFWLRHQVLALRSPADKVVFESDPRAAADLLGSDPSYRREIAGDPRTNATVASWMPPQLADFSALFAPSGGVNFRAHAPVIFVGERVTPAGRRVLLVLRFEAYVVETEAYVVESGETQVQCQFGYDLYGRRVEGNNDVLTRVSLLPWPGTFDRIFAARADEKDPTHLSFRYVAGGQEGIIDAWLEERSLRMQARSGPATTPAAGRAE